MVIRVGFTALALVLPVAAIAQSLPYDLDNLVYPARAVRPPQSILPPTRPIPVPQPAPRNRVDYDVDRLLFNRTPDYMALGYDLTGLTGLPMQAERRDHGPLEYRLDGLVQARTRFAPARAD